MLGRRSLTLLSSSPSPDSLWAPPDVPPQDRTSLLALLASVAYSVSFERDIVPVQDRVHPSPLQFCFTANMTGADESAMNSWCEALYSPECVERLSEKVLSGVSIAHLAGT